jgi:hypothetical protein
MLKLSIECTRLEVNIVAVYVAAVEELRKKERRVQNRMKLSLAQKVVHFCV